MSNTHLYTIFLSLLVSCPAYASDGDKQSFIASMLNSQFPFNAFNTSEKQRKSSDDEMGVIVPFALEGDYKKRQKVLFGSVGIFIEGNEKQILLNSRANISLISAIPFILYPKTRKFGLGMCCVAGSLKLDAARRLPHVDIGYVKEVFEEVEKIVTEQTLNQRPIGSSDNANDSI